MASSDETVNGEDNDDFLSSFKKSIDDNKIKGKSVIEEMQITIKERNAVIEQRDVKIKELEGKNKELTVMAKDAFLSPKSGAPRLAGSEDEGMLREKLDASKGEINKLTAELKELRKVADKVKRLEAKNEEQRKEIMELRGKKDFDLSCFLEEGEDPTLVAQTRVLKTRIKALEKKLLDDKVDDLKEEIRTKLAECKDLERENKALESRVKDLESKMDMLELTPPPPPPQAHAGPGAPAGSHATPLPEPPSFKQGPPTEQRFSSPPPPPPSPGTPVAPAAPGMPPSPPTPASAPLAHPSSVPGPSPGAGGQGSEVATLQRELRDLRGKYSTVAREIDEFKASNDPQTILNLKTRRIHDLQDEIKELRKQVQANPDIKELRDAVEALRADIQQKEATISMIDNEKATLIYYYNDLKEKYEQIYTMIQERDQYIADLMQRLQ